MDLSSLSTADLQAITSGDMSKVSDEGLRTISGGASYTSELAAKLQSNGMNVPQERLAAPKAQSPSDSLLSMWKSGILGPLEGAAHVASGAVATPVAGLAGLGQMANNALGVGPQQDPSDVVNATQNALTYQPRSDAGKSVARVVGKVGGYVGDKINDVGQSASEATGSPAYGAATSALATALPDILGMEVPTLGKGKIAATAQEAVDAAPRQAQIDQARAAGYHLSPSEITNAPAGKLANGIAGKDQVNQVLALHNQRVTNNIAKADVGAPSDVPLPQGLDKLEEAAGNAYDAVRNADKNVAIVRDAGGTPIKTASGKYVARPAGPIKLDDEYFKDVSKIEDGADNAAPGAQPNPQVVALKAQLENASSAFSPEDAIKNLKQTRFDAKANLKNAQDPAKLALGQAQMQAAEALEGQIARYLKNTGQTTLYKDFTAARTTIAKVKTIRDAMDASGNVDASAINAYRNRGGYVDGGLKTIADAADSFDKVVKNTQGVQAPAPISALGWMATAAGLPVSMTGHGEAGAMASAIGAMMAARPLARAGINAEMYQRMLRGQAPAAGPLSQLAAQPASPLAALGVTPDAPAQ